MKKTLCLILVAVMAIAMFAACGSDEKETANTTSASASATAAAEETGDWKYIKDKGELVIGITYFAPMNYLDDNNELVGFETEFAKAVCEKLGIKAKFVEIDWDTKEVELNSKNIDCIWNGMTINDDRKANMAISVPYMRNKQVMVAVASDVDKYTTSDGVTGKIVISEQGSAGEELAANNDFFAGANAISADTQAKCLLEIKSKTADVAIIDYVMSIGTIGEGTDFADLAVVPGVEFDPEEYGVAFRKDSNTVEKINEAMQQLANDGTLKTIADKYKLGELLLVNPK